MLSFSLDTSPKSFSPLVNRLVDNGLFKVSPDRHHALLLCAVSRRAILLCRCCCYSNRTDRSRPISNFSVPISRQLNGLYLCRKSIPQFYNPLSAFSRNGDNCILILSFLALFLVDCNRQCIFSYLIFRSFDSAVIGLCHDAI